MCRVFSLTTINKYNHPTHIQDSREWFLASNLVKKVKHLNCTLKPKRNAPL